MTEMALQTARHLLVRLGHRSWLNARLAQARSLAAIPAPPLPSCLNMHARTLSSAKDIGQRENMEMSQPHPKLPTITVASVSPNPSTAMLHVYWGEGGMDEFPYVWLRDNCQCSKCFHPTAFSRLMLVDTLQLSVSPTTLQVTDGGDVEIQWSDGHQSTYPACWLQERSFKPTQQLQHEQVFRLKRSFWGSELAENLPRASFTELMEEDMALLKFLQQLEILGFTVVTEAPRKIGQLESLSKRVGYLDRTHYGETFIVESKPQPSNVAYTSDSINLHSDLTYNYQKPSIQLLHCIKQFPGKGGDNMLSDSLQAAQRFRSLHPDKFLTLANTMVEFWDKGKDNEKEFHIINRHPIIR
ncbi:gamma-butyrobetaine dioxygenase-like isoform X2 [Panulirus ornatus]|uniref:gamma-butyrobetaine dioxygenase-like isoform X2 n=1 Tax=Panulirus ornatus TaxID=150431 RepID=UPI003A87BEC8